MSSEEIVPISKVKVLKRCPRCNNTSLISESVQDEETSLWSFIQRCTMCGWKREVSNVKAGV